MCVVWPYLHSTCVCVQTCIFISRRCYFIGTYSGNILPLSIQSLPSYGLNIITIKMVLTLNHSQRLISGGLMVSKPSRVNSSLIRCLIHTVLCHISAKILVNYYMHILSKITELKSIILFYNRLLFAFGDSVSSKNYS